ncbi:MAG: hypothetical protein M1832_006416 [Thelocarpon impressellum]|nr:MAG: hypothetical protein M1832_006416 [Thelocarpon impressellum]
MTGHSVALSPIGLLPTVNGKSISPRKIDLALRYSESHPTVAATYGRLRQIAPTATLSQASDATNRDTALASIIEVKSSAGDYMEATVQLGTWAAAGLEKLRRVAAEVSGTEYVCERLWPLPCWTVVGHVWTLHIAYKEKDGAVIVLGPFVSGGTASHHDVFILLDTLRRLNEYADEYWAWFQRDILSLALDAEV